MTRNGNFGGTRRVYGSVRKRLLRGIPWVLAVASAGAYDHYSSARQKFDLIASDRLRAGARVQWSEAELIAYAEREMPAGVRAPKLRLGAPGEATGSAMIDFGKVRRAQGHEPGWLLAKLLDGERPVSVTARLRSAGGQATVDVQRVEISGVEINGATLDFLIQNILLAMYPDAMVGRPFQLSHHIEKLEVAPSGVAALIGK